MIKPSFSQVSDSFNIYNTKGAKDRSNVMARSDKSIRSASKGVTLPNTEKKIPHTVRTDSSNSKH